jgi:CheY-like chemotaxis protein
MSQSNQASTRLSQRSDVEKITSVKTNHKKEVIMVATALTFPKTATMSLANSILLVDDSAIYRGALRREFEEAGWNVYEAADGLAAVEKAEQMRPQLILLDLAMPKMNGLAAARVLRQLLPEVRLMLLTGYGYLFKSTEVSSVGIDAVVSKGEPIAELLVKARSVLRFHPVLEKTEGKVDRQFGARSMRGTPKPVREIRNSSATALIWSDVF